MIEPCDSTGIPPPRNSAPAPYQRVSMMAHQVKAKNPNAKILIFGPKRGFSRPGRVQEGWEEHSPGITDWLDAGLTADISG